MRNNLFAHERLLSNLLLFHYFFYVGSCAIRQICAHSRRHIYFRCCSALLTDSCRDIRVYVYVHSNAYFIQSVAHKHTLIARFRTHARTQTDFVSHDVYNLTKNEFIFFMFFFCRIASIRSTMYFRESYASYKVQCKCVTEEGHTNSTFVRSPIDVVY